MTTTETTRVLSPLDLILARIDAKGDDSTIKRIDTSDGGGPAIRRPEAAKARPVRRSGALAWCSDCGDVATAHCRIHHETH